MLWKLRSWVLMPRQLKAGISDALNKGQRRGEVISLLIIGAWYGQELSCQRSGQSGHTARS